MSAASFRRLDAKVTHEYESKGYSPKRAKAIGRATAGKTAHRKWRRDGLPAEVQRQRACIKKGLQGRQFRNRSEQHTAFIRVVEDCAKQERARHRRRGR